MTAISELDLPMLNIEDPGLAEDPAPFIESARQRHPWLARCSFGYAVHEYEAMRDLLMMNDEVRTSNDAIVDIMGARGTPWGNFMETMMLARTGPEHIRLRSSISMAFAPPAVNRHRPLIRRVISDLLDEWAPRGAFDFNEFAAHFPIRVTCALIGASPESIPAVRASLEAQAISFNLDPSLTPTLHAAYRQLWEFVDDLIVRRQQRGGPMGEQLLDVMISARDSGKISDQELHDVLIVLFAAGFDTTRNTLTMVVRLLIQFPEVWARCADDWEYCVRAVNEAMRYHGPSNVYRTVAKDLVYRGVFLPAGTQLFFTNAMSGRDPKAFPDPDRYCPEREGKNRHMAFGRGAHICLGRYLATAEIEEGMHLIAQRIVRPLLTAKVSWRPFPGSWGIITLPIEFEAGPKRPMRAAT